MLVKMKREINRVMKNMNGQTQETNSVFKTSPPPNRVERIKNAWAYMGFLLFLTRMPRAFADIPTPPSDLQINSGQSVFKMLANLIVEDVLPLVLPGIEIVLVIYAVWSLMSAMQSSKKSGDWGEFKSQAIFSGVLIAIAGALVYFAYTLAGSIDVQS